MDLNFDIKAKIDEAVKKLQEEPALLKSFRSEPVETVEKLIGVDLPDDKLQPVIAGIKAKLTASEIGGTLDGLKKLF